MDDRERILARIDSERLLSLLEESVSVYSPTFSEAPVIDVFRDALDAGGVPCRFQAVPGPYEDENRGNLLVELGPKPASLLWIGHMDTITLRQAEEHAFVREGEILRGLGSADMKGGCSAIVEALVALIQSGVSFKRGLAVGLVVGEEEYGDGAQALLEKISAPLAIVGEPTGLVPCLSHFGYAEYRLEVSGARAHAALPEVGASAIHAMMSWMLAVLDGVPQLPSGMDTSVNPREIHGGTGLFVVAERCEALLDVHLPPGFDTMPIEALLRSAQRKAQDTHPGCTFDFQCLYWAPGYSGGHHDERLDPLLSGFAGAREVFAPEPFRSHSDGSQLFQKGCLPVVLGPGKLEHAHVRDEHVALSEVTRACRLYAEIIYECCVR